MQDQKRHFRILCVGGHKSPSNAWRRVLTFQKMGHEVDSLDTTPFGLFKTQLLRKFTLGPGLSIVRLLLTHQLQRKISSFQPKIVFFEKSTWLRPEDINRLRSIGPSGMKLVHYNPDDPFGSYHKGWGTFVRAIPFYDVHFVPKEVNIKEYKEYKANHVYKFDRSFDPDLHRPLILSDAEKRKFECDIGFIGTYAEYRESAIARLLQSGILVTVWGNGWYHGKNWNVIRPHWRGPGRYDEDYTKAICGMKIALHFLRRENRDEQDSRTFEIPACGTFMLAERSHTHKRLFRENVEAVYFSRKEELVCKVAYYLENSTKRKAIAQAGRQRCLESGYDHASRLDELLSKILTSNS